MLAVSVAVSRPLGILIPGSGPTAATTIARACGARWQLHGAEPLLAAVPRHFASTGVEAATRTTRAQAPIGTGAVERERTASISVHKGFKIQAALCVERPPLYVQEPEFKKRWRAFKDAWELQTKNNLSISDDIVYMRYHFQFLEDIRASRALGGAAPAAAVEARGGGAGEVTAAGAGLGGGGGGGGGGGLDALLSGEGLDLAFPKQGRKTVRRRRGERKVEERVDNADVHSIKRLAERSLYLLVRYASASKWTFPKSDRPHGQAMRETLLRLCGRQLGPSFSPYIIGACPFAHRKRRSDRYPGIEGRKVFYYRARALPGASSEVVLEAGGLVSDWAWVSREELPDYLDTGEWYSVRDGLPLDSIFS